MLSDYEGLKDEIDSLVPALVKESNGLFIWISLVLGNVEEFERFEVREEDVKKILVEVEYSSTRMPWLDLKKRLVELTKLDLPSLYCRALFKAYPTPELQRDFKIVIGVLLEAKIPLSKGLSLRWSRSYTRLSTIISKPQFVTPIASQIFLADFNSSSINMAVACMAIVNQIKLDEDESIIRLVDFTEEEEYAITYWQSHFSDALGKAPRAQQIELIRSLHTLSCENPRKLGYFVEELMTRGKLNDVFMGIALVTSCLSEVDFERMHVKEIQTRFRELTSKLQRQGLYLELDGDKEE
ncbi:hypothetical protein BDR26DRAFT_938290 [Obelidium mucronatum]|nr:hypothetical protein BDR26DRAFT_938290 [Obelidium mucronatum]